MFGPRGTRIWSTENRDGLRSSGSSGNAEVPSGVGIGLHVPQRGRRVSAFPEGECKCDYADHLYQGIQ